MANERRILIVAQPELSRSLEAPLRSAGWRVYRSPDVVSLGDAMQSVRPHFLLVGLDTPWFDATALNRIVSAAKWHIPVMALTSLTTVRVEGPITFLPAETPVSEIVESVEKAAERHGSVAHA